MLTQPVRDEKIRLDGVSLHCVQWGQQGTPVICIHGLTANAFCFQAFADYLVPSHRVFAYDLRGRGESEKPAQGYSVPIHAADLAQLIDTLQLEKPVVIGHSLGAMIALYFAAHYPEKLSKLVLIDAGAPYEWKTVEDQPAWLKNSVSRLGSSTPSYDDYLAHLKMAPYLGPYWNAYMDLYFTHDVAQQPDGSVISKVSLPGIIEEAMNTQQARPDEQWAHVQVPTLLLRAGQKLLYENDQILSERAAHNICQGIASCQFHDFPNLNHYTIIFGVDQGPAEVIASFIRQS
ncbi:alpha/beta fold hydrolase [Dictyobacter aurantiacus]|uniref:Alpha/beta hydrolase n=1 Tax=Dictyobacter aurantiacus TaxID=1936993 RepID=A0A401ZSI3_9CHLR|nr:alpha/beta hydrolase [Dictyobacter aurantiacus]GCE09821.1 alpha/beta hydrolase [Dictyobacter aurantiacus]